MEEVSSSRLKRKMGSRGDCDADPNPLYCSVCEVLCNSTAMMEKHVNGKKHKKKLLGQTRTINTWKFWCDSCRIGCNSDATKKMHLGGKMHRESCKRRRLLQVETEKEDCCNEKDQKIQNIEETCNICEEEEVEVRNLIEKEEEEEETKKEESTNKEACNEKEEEAEQACIEEEELKVEEEGFKKDDVCDDEKMQDKEAENTKGKGGLWCDICELQCNSYPMMLAHRSGKKHIAKEAKAGFKVNKVDQEELEQDKKMREIKEETNREFWCLICRVTFDTQGKIAKHLKGAEHKAKVTSRR